MIHKYRITDLLHAVSAKDSITVNAWVRTRRDSKDFSFIELNDGSCLTNIQVIADKRTAGYELISEMNTGAAVRITGDLVSSPGKGQKWEIKASAIELLGTAPEDFPLHKEASFG